MIFSANTQLLLHLFFNSEEQLLQHCHRFCVTVKGSSSSSAILTSFFYNFVFVHVYFFPSIYITTNIFTIFCRLCASSQFRATYVCCRLLPTKYCYCFLLLFLFSFEECQRATLTFVQHSFEAFDGRFDCNDAVISVYSSNSNCNNENNNNNCSQLNHGKQQSSYHSAVVHNYSSACDGSQHYNNNNNKQ